MNTCVFAYSADHKHDAGAITYSMLTQIPCTTSEEQKNVKGLGLALGDEKHSGPNLLRTPTFIRTLLRLSAHVSELCAWSGPSVLSDEFEES